MEVTNHNSMSIFDFLNRVIKLFFHKLAQLIQILNAFVV